jgi:hypothetical protein
MNVCVKNFLFGNEVRVRELTRLSDTVSTDHEKTKIGAGVAGCSTQLCVMPERKDTALKLQPRRKISFLYVCRSGANVANKAKPWYMRCQHEGVSSWANQGNAAMQPQTPESAPKIISVTLVLAR